MKLWKFQIFLEDERSIIRFDRPLSHHDLERIGKLLMGGYHIRADPKRKPKPIPGPVTYPEGKE